MTKEDALASLKKQLSDAGWSIRPASAYDRGEASGAWVRIHVPPSSPRLFTVGCMVIDKEWVAGDGDGKKATATRVESDMARKKTTEEEDRDTLEKLAGIGEKRANRKMVVTRPVQEPVGEPSDPRDTLFLDEDDAAVIAALCARTGIHTPSDIIRLAIREACEARGINHVRLVEDARFSRQVDANYGKEKALCPALPLRVEARRPSRLQRASKRA